ncbi:hypothetical protein EU803_05865 [Loktanella sp. IMCC34160]|uniref:hypothetical protein n=1 Tax=Loktanella sp. IMCC34160 TaxID=2510646 RepID=UPI00101DBA79|nr:hypothetical protein [Loktanella sp. IMCC34160]RYG91977.1 hypothetical protein EU803_05865 [Loktanella sp. IMCC34160]
MKVLRFLLRLVGVALFLGGLYVTLFFGLALSQLNGHSPSVGEMAFMAIMALGIVGPLMVLGVHLAYWRWRRPRRSDVAFHVLVWLLTIPGLTYLPLFALISAALSSIFIAVGRGEPRA